MEFSGRFEKRMMNLLLRNAGKNTQEWVKKSPSAAKHEQNTEKEKRYSNNNDNDRR